VAPLSTVGFTFNVSDSPTSRSPLDANSPTDRMPRERGTRRVVSRRRACPSLKVPTGAEARSKGGTARPGREPPFRHRPPARHHGSCGGGTSLSFLLRPLQPPPRLAAAQVPFPASLACVLISVALPYAR
jgi:hypothetical protein